jgi:hypothetical protein
VQATIHGTWIRYYPNGSSNVVMYGGCISLSLVIEPKDYGHVEQKMGEVRFSLLDRAGDPHEGTIRRG